MHFGSADVTSQIIVTGAIIENCIVTNDRIECSATNMCRDATYIRIPDGTINISANAFRGNDLRLISVEILDSVTRIGNGAFKGCRNLSSISLGNGLESIGNPHLCIVELQIFLW